MDDAMTEMDFRARPTPERPLLGLTVLVVEDSQYASDGMRLLCLRSGARIRRADCIASAERHLNVYQPSVAIVDLGLPDGSGLDLIAAMDARRPRVPILLGTSGADRDAAGREVRAAGADDFMAKPIESLVAFQALILSHMPESLRPKGPRVVEACVVAPDLIAYREDLSHAMDLLRLDDPPVRYLRRFLLGVARTAHDDGLEDQAADMLVDMDPTARHALRSFLSRRIQALPVGV